MKGIIFNLLEEFVCENFGEDKYDDILDDTTLQTKEPFVGPGTYPDSDLIALVQTTASHLDISVPDALKAFGKWTFPKLAAITPQFVDIHTNPKDFLMTVESIIHVEVKKLYPDAKTPTFEYNDIAPGRLILKYKSDRKLYPLMEGLLEGVAEHFNSSIKQSYKIGNENGVEYADFDLTFS